MSAFSDGVREIAAECARDNLPAPTFIVTGETMRVIERNLSDGMFLLAGAHALPLNKLTYAGVVFMEWPIGGKS